MTTLVRNLLYVYYVTHFAACGFYFIALQYGLGPDTVPHSSCARWLQMGTAATAHSLFTGYKLWSFGAARCKR